jgi:hypothetical protein
MRIRKLAWQLPLAALALWLSLEVVKSVYPNDLLCGETVGTSEEAFDAALRYMKDRMQLPPDKEIRLYRSQHENCWVANRKKEVSLFMPARWSVIMELPSTTEGRVFRHVLHVYECRAASGLGGGVSWLGKTPAEEGPRPRNCR